MEWITPVPAANWLHTVDGEAADILITPLSVVIVEGTLHSKNGFYFLSAHQRRHYIGIFFPIKLMKKVFMLTIIIDRQKSTVIIKSTVYIQ